MIQKKPIRRICPIAIAVMLLCWTEVCMAQKPDEAKKVLPNKLDLQYVPLTGSIFFHLPPVEESTEKKTLLSSRKPDNRDNYFVPLKSAIFNHPADAIETEFNTYDGPGFN
jgi:hypothetical protein